MITPDLHYQLYRVTRKKKQKTTWIGRTTVIEIIVRKTTRLQQYTKSNVFDDMIVVNFLEDKNHKRVWLLISKFTYICLIEVLTHEY